MAFIITQHSRDKVLLENISRLLECGRVETRDACDFVVTSFNDFNKYMIPYWKNYPLIGHKSNDCLDFIRVYEIMLTKGHLTEEGLTKIVDIKTLWTLKGSRI